MTKWIVLVLSGIFLFFGSNLAEANMAINEIMYAPSSGSEHEWVEIFNNGASPVSLTNYRFFHGEMSSPLSLKKGNSATLSPSTYAIIAKSLPDYGWLNFSGPIFSASTLSLPDSGGNTSIAISDPNKKILDSVTYDPALGGGKNSGNSLAKVNGVWKGASPSPGAANQNTSASSNTRTAGSSAQSVSETKAKTESSKIKVKISAKTLAFTGMPVLFSASATGYAGERLFYGKYFWNFGDGDSKVVRTEEAAEFPHTFFYESEYPVSLQYSQNYYSTNVDASNSVIIKVVKPDISISKVGRENDFFIEVSNNTDYEADISKWFLLSGSKSFTFPGNSILQPKKKIVLPPQITGFSFYDKNALKLVNSEGADVFEFSSSLPVRVSAKSFVPAKVSVADDVEIADDLPAEAVKSESPGTDFKYGVFGLLFFLGLGASSAYLIRRRKRRPASFEDFEAIDE